MGTSDALEGWGALPADTQGCPAVESLAYLLNSTLPSAVDVTTDSLDSLQETGRETVGRGGGSRVVHLVQQWRRGSPGADPTVPRAVDLSANFPIPGDQGQQGSCVGWATAYALESFQERIEIGWSLNTTDHLFSPAWIYNQINGGRDAGSLISDALDLVVANGCATWSSMPYRDDDFLRSPTAAARAEAANFRGRRWYLLDRVSAIKAARINRLPVVLGIRVYPSFFALRGLNSVYNTADRGRCPGGSFGAVSAPSGWDINLVLSPSEVLDRGPAHYLFYETMTNVLAPGGTFFRDAANPAPFDLTRDYGGNPIPAGTYYMALWVDDLEDIDEANERNNASFGANLVTLTAPGAGKAQKRDATGAIVDVGARASYGGRRLPGPGATVRKVEIARDDAGGVSLRMVDDPAYLELSRRVRAADPAIFPARSGRAMPEVEGGEE